jgi:hypothetical protein
MVQPWFEYKSFHIRTMNSCYSEYKSFIDEFMLLLMICTCISHELIIKEIWNKICSKGHF